MRMKLYFGGAVLLALGGCSNETVPGVNDGEGRDLVPVTLALNRSSADVDGTRGTGTVGGTTDEANVWRYENLYVLMTTSDRSALEDENAEWGFSSVCGTVLKEQFDNTFYARPVSVESNAANGWTINYTCDPNEGGNVKYYPAQGNSDFFAYYVDDAAKNTDAKGNPEYVMDNNAIYVPFVINGSQDLLTGKADASATGEGQGFSAKTARANIIPNIRMKHMLTRLTFTLKNGNENAANITVNSVSVESKNSGKMFVAYQSEPVQKIIWDDSLERLYLKRAMTPEDPGYFVSSLASGKCPLTDFTPVVMDGKNDINVGEALFVNPGESEYLMHIELEHGIVVDGSQTTQPVDVRLPLRLGGQKFESGKSYHVNATVYGLESIHLETELEKWVEYGEDIEVGSDSF